jgi:diacylglycerol O-acyltransferase / wax synthase
MAQPTDWVSAPVMSPLDTVMWRGDADRRLRSSFCALEILDRLPDWDRLVAAHDWATRMVPRFRQRVVDSPLGVGAPSWAIDEDFDLHYHLRRVRLSGDGSFRELLTVAEQIGMTPLDPARPPWEATLFDGLPDGKSAYLVKIHHAITDGLGAVDCFSRLHSTTRKPSPKPQPPAREPENPRAATVIGRQIASDLAMLPDVGGAVVNGLRAMVRPRAALRRALRYGRSAYQVTGLGSPPGSPLLRRRSLSWRFLAFDIDFAELKAAGKAAGASVNDAYLAGLIGSFRRYHKRLGHPIETMPVAIPISTRTADDPSGGNRIAVGRIAAAVGLDDPLELMLTVREQVRIARREPAADLFRVISPAVAWLPGAAMSLVGGVTSVNDLQASNVPGIQHDAYLAGAKVERLYPFGPLPGCAVMAAMVTHGSVACVGINYDAASVIDPDRFAECVIDGFADVLSLAGNGSRPTRRI